MPALIPCPSRSTRSAVRHRRFVLVSGLLAASVLLAGCGQDPQILKANQSGMSIALDSEVDSLAEAVEVANQHCVNVRRIAVLDTVETVGGRRIAFFDCVEVS